MAGKSKAFAGLLSGAGVALALSAAANAAPQYDSRYYDKGAGAVVRCESRDGRPRSCPTAGDVRLARQLSDLPCIEGRTWGRDRGGVWVTQGCRADFITTGYGYREGDDNRYRDDYRRDDYSRDGARTYRCESRDGRYRRCDFEVRGRASLVRQLSDTPCIEGRTWGYNRGGVWVDRGCRAEFSVRRGWGSDWAGYPGDGYSDVIRCESRDGRTARCGADVRRGVRLLRQFSGSPCIEGRSWGWERGGVWVSGGCRAEFRVD
jgi:hypothetical protein